MRVCMLMLSTSTMPLSTVDTTSVASTGKTTASTSYEETL